MNPITKKDIVRLLDDQIEDPDEIERIFSAMETDPQLAALFAFLGNFDTDDVELSDQDRMQFPDLTRTRLCCLSSPPKLEDLPDGQSTTSKVEYLESGQIESFELEFRKQGKRVLLNAVWPNTLSPIGFVLSQFDLVRGRTPFRQEIKLPPTTYKSLESKRNRTQQTKSYSASARTTEKRSRDDNSVHFSAFLNKSGITVHSSNEATAADEILVVELTYQGDHEKEKSIRFPFQALHQPYAIRRTTLIEDFPWPRDAVSEKATLIIRPLDEADFPLLSPELVSNLLGVNNQFVALPVMTDEQDQYCSPFRYQTIKKMAIDQKTVWSLRMTENGGLNEHQ